MKALALSALFLLPAVPPRAAVIVQGSGAQRVIALTFDAGADRGYAMSILSTLERNHIHGSFGMTGLWARANPDLVHRIAHDGDQFINHTYDHRSFTGVSSRALPLSVAQRTWEITQADRVIRRISGHSSKPYFRPPFGDYDAATLTLIRRLGYRYSVMWTIDSLGWAHLSAPAIVQRCLVLAKPGAILLMHVGSQSQDAIALPAVIKALRHRYYTFVTVSRLITGH